MSTVKTILALHTKFLNVTLRWTRFLQPAICCHFMSDLMQAAYLNK